MRAKRVIVSAWSYVLLTVVAAVGGSGVGTGFTYQGQLKRGGVPENADCEMQFALFDSAVDGTQIGSTLVLPGITVVDGLFLVELDFGAAAFPGEARWLQVGVRCGGDVNVTILTPRQRLSAAPHAVSADVLDGLDSSAFLQAVPNPLTLTGNAAGSPIIQGSNSSATAGAQGVLGEATAATGATFGVWGVAASSGGIGVLGQHAATSGSGAGVTGESSSNSGSAAGVHGRVNGTAAVNYGVFGESPSTAGRGLYGKATAATGTAYGVYGESASTSGVGVFGYAPQGDGVSGQTDADSKAAVRALCSNSNGWALFARHSSPAGTRAAILAETASGITGAKAIQGLATNSAGATIGLYGESAGNGGQGVFGIATASTGLSYGVQGETNSTTLGASGVLGHATGNVGKTYGVQGLCDSDAGYAVFGNHAGAGRGVYGASSAGPGVYATTATGAQALYAERTQNSNRAWLGGLNEGAWAESLNGTGLVAKTTNGTNAIYGQNLAAGNQGWLGGITEGAQGQAAVGNGVVGITADLLAAGGYFRNDGGGDALFADGHAKVRTLEILDGGDLAEPFEITDRSSIRAPIASEGPIRTRSASDGSDDWPQAVAGMVVVIDRQNPGAMTLSSDPYDRKVAGVISGANGLSPGMVMKANRQAVGDGAELVALTGRVWCWCDATSDAGSGPIEPGDLLTTSPTLGHAMKAADGSRAHGAVIGKAMTGLADGRGLVLVLVNLQ